MLQAVQPDAGPARAEVVNRILPVISTVRQDLSFDRESGFATLEMRYDPARKSVRPLVNGNVLGPENFGFDQFLDYPGVDISVYQLESETGEAVIGDIRFEMA